MLTLLLALAILPIDEPVRDRVDVIELNHVYDREGDKLYDQLIFWDWSQLEADYQVRAWRIVKSPTCRPRRDFDRGGYQVQLCEPYSLLLRTIVGGAFRESWTQADLEHCDRSKFPQECRRGLLFEKSPCNSITP
jgi:hypothetical protein